MKRIHKIFLLVAVVAVLAILLAAPALAITTEEVEAHVQSVGREKATGNLVIWFLCAIAFLKASQKIDSFMASLGISVGRTGGSMLSEAMVAARGVGMAKSAFGSGAAGGVGFGGKGGAAGGARSAGGAPGGGGTGLAGIIGRKLTNSAVQSVTANQTTPHDSTRGDVPQSPSSTSGVPGSSAANNVNKSTGAGDQPIPTEQPKSGETGGSGDNALGHGAHVEGGPAPIPTVQTNDGVGVLVADAETGEQLNEPLRNSIPTTSDAPSGVGIEDLGASAEYEAGASGNIASAEISDSQAQTPDVAPAGEAVHGEAATGMGAGGYQAASGGGVGRRVFERSLARGGSFATRVTSAVALGSIANTGTMQGATAAAALTSYLGGSGGGGNGVLASGGSIEIPGAGGDVGSGAGGAVHGEPAPQAPEMSHAPIPTFTNVEIGGGRITGIETSPDNPGGIPFAMYSADQYMQPEGEHASVTTKDGAMWYKQYAQDAVERKPFKDEDGLIKYDEQLVKRMPRMPHRKDRV